VQEAIQVKRDQDMKDHIQKIYDKDS